MPDPGLVQGAAESVDAWQRAWEQYLHYCGDPVAEASQAGRRDESFVMGPLFASVYRILAGAPTDAPALRQDAARALSRGRTAEDRERAHTAALRSLLAGEFTAAALAWDAIARRGRDFAAARFAHDVYLHVGDDDRRLASSSHAEECWRDQPGYGFVAGQHAFALEEAGRYAEAEEFGRHALSLDPDDLWARHALAHVYESTDDSPSARELLEGSVERWSRQDLLATHIWWHLALRLLADGDLAAASRIFDERQDHADTAFQLCDQTSLLWRLELLGGDAQDRWQALADRWDEITERHTCGFIDLHAVLAFARQPAHPGAARWSKGLRERVLASLPSEPHSTAPSAGGAVGVCPSPADDAVGGSAPSVCGAVDPSAGAADGARSGSPHSSAGDGRRSCPSENDDIFREVVAPLAEAFRSYADGGHDRFLRLVGEAGSSVRRIGGSIVQRDLIRLTARSAETAGDDAADGAAVAEGAEASQRR